MKKVHRSKLNIVELVSKILNRKGLVDAFATVESIKGHLKLPSPERMHGALCDYYGDENREKYVVAYWLYLFSGNCAPTFDDFIHFLDIRGIENGIKTFNCSKAKAFFATSAGEDLLPVDDLEAFLNCFADIYMENEEIQSFIKYLQDKFITGKKLRVNDLAGLDNQQK